MSTSLSVRVGMGLRRGRGGGRRASDVDGCRTVSSYFPRISGGLRGREEGGKSSREVDEFTIFASSSFTIARSFTSVETKSQRLMLQLKM
jgi:hypothetical protein